METFEDYINHMINEGFIAENGSPLKCCHCESKNLVEHDHDYLDYFQGHGINLLEYKVKCKDCDKNVGYWVSGHWEV